MSAQIHPDIETVLLTEEEIRTIVADLGAQISEDYADRNPLIVSVLRGAFIFAADLMRAITVPCAVDFMAVSSYGDGVKSTGVVQIIKDLSTKVEGRHVLLVEDILDTGLTLKYLMGLINGRGPASIEVATFAIKDIPGNRPAIDPLYVGAHVPNEFVVGYGLDYAERYRNLPFVGILKPEVYS
ncbi:MAG: hypoxanthine phosphoribosyltransferase [Atopobiaceae bacterium]|nr:hypoxanthine phosphoribosyltransferase [Atopobiaceae bacterium]